MAEIGVRELKARACKIVRELREGRARYVITYRGKPVGVLMPVPESESRELSAHAAPEDAWEELEALGEEIARGWRAEESAVEILSEMRG